MARGNGSRTGHRACRSATAAHRHVTTSGQARREPDQVDLGDTELDVLAFLGCLQWTSMDRSWANQSGLSSMCHMPTRLIQPPRLVDDATSGLTVTTRAATSGATRDRSSRNRPSACWVDSGPRREMPSSTGGLARGSSVPAQGERGAWARRAQGRSSGLPGGNLAQGPPGQRPSSRASWCHWSAERRAEWFPGWPSVGRRQALMV